MSLRRDGSPSASRRAPRSLQSQERATLSVEKRVTQPNHGYVRLALSSQQKGTHMRIATLIVAGLGAISLAACESSADKAAEAKADSLEAQAAATPNESMETQLNAQADAIEQQAGNADGGATTENTPDTSPSK